VCLRAAAAIFATAPYLAIAVGDLEGMWSCPLSVRVSLVFRWPLLAVVNGVAAQRILATRECGERKCGVHRCGVHICGVHGLGLVVDGVGLAADGVGLAVDGVGLAVDGVGLALHSAHGVGLMQYLLS